MLALFLKFCCKGILSQGFILIAVVIVGVIGGSCCGVMNWQSVLDAEWFALPRIFPFKDFPGVGTGKAIAIIGAAILGGLSGYIGSMFESVGDYAATCAACDIGWVKLRTYCVKDRISPTSIVFRIASQPPRIETTT